MCVTLSLSFRELTESRENILYNILFPYFPTSYFYYFINHIKCNLSSKLLNISSLPVIPIHS